MELNQGQWQQIDSLLAEGRKIEAIKLYREVTGLGLKEAKDAIEARSGELSAPDAPPSGELDAARWKQIDAELFGGRKISAIRLYRQFVGADLKTAKEAMDTRESVLREQSPRLFSAPAGKSGCLGMLVLTLAPLLLVCLLFRLLT